MTEEQIAEYYENRYRNQARTTVVADDEDTYGKVFGLKLNFPLFVF